MSYQDETVGKSFGPQGPDKIGEGGMAIVYRATMSRWAAMWRSRPCAAVGRDEEFVACFRRGVGRGPV